MAYVLGRNGETRVDVDICMERRKVVTRPSYIERDRESRGGRGLEVRD